MRLLETRSRTEEKFIKSSPIYINRTKVSINTNVTAPKNIHLSPQVTDYNYSLLRNSRSSTSRSNSLMIVTSEKELPRNITDDIISSPTNNVPLFIIMPKIANI